MYYLSSRNLRQIPLVKGVAAPRHIPGVSGVRTFSSLGDKQDRMALPANSPKGARTFASAVPTDAPKEQIDVLKDRLVSATMKAEQQALKRKIGNIDESNFRRTPNTPEEHKFVNDCFNLFDLNSNGVIEVWEINAVYESGSGSAVGACFIEAGLAGEVRNSGLARGKSVGNLEETVYTYGVDFTQNAQVLKAMDLVRAVKKGRVRIEGDQQFDRYVTKDEFSRWAMRLVELHSASQLENASLIDETRPDVVELNNEAVRM
jgi:hypothetical protein